MPLNETDRQELLKAIGLEPDGEKLTVTPPPKAKATKPKAKAKPEEVELPDVEALTTEQLLTPGAFDRYKLNASDVGRKTSQPHNKRLYARIQEAINNQRTAHQEAKLAAKKQRKRQDRNHVREKVKEDTTSRAAKKVLEAMKESGIDLDALATMLKEREL